ncbi:MAG: tetrahydrofolate dehydrogenase/cyclohydrolase catalytic domain-containing protein [candidate division WOR-3 bacterium]
MAKILDGKLVSSEWRKEIHEKVLELKEKGITPFLNVFLIGDNPASLLYVKNKKQTAEKIDIKCEIIHFPGDISKEKLKEEIKIKGEDKNVHGIIVQLPLPNHLDPEEIAEFIPPEKDVDGFTPYNLGKLVRGDPVFIPATPYGILKILDYYKISVTGKHVVIVGRSNIVGKPMALSLLLKGRDATVTVCHSKTENLNKITQEADILIVAAGVKRLIKKDFVREGQVVIDVGIHKEGDSWIGDVDFEEVKDIVDYITPVPGGVGPMTVAGLLANTCKSAELLIKNGRYN